MDLIKIAESASLEMDGLPLCSPGLPEKCEDGTCGECAKCFQKEVIVEDDVEAQTPRASDNRVHSGGIGAHKQDRFTFDTPKAMSGSNNLDTISFDLSPDVDDEYTGRLPQITSSMPVEPQRSDSQSEPIYDFSSQSSKPEENSSSWLNFLSMPSLPMMNPFQSLGKPAEQESPKEQLAMPVTVAAPVLTQQSYNNNVGNDAPLGFKRSQPIRIKQISKASYGSSPSNKAGMKEISARTVRAGNMPTYGSQNEMSQSQSMLIKPIELGVKRQDSVALFARPSVSKDASNDESDMMKSRSTDGNDDKRVSIHDSGKDGEHSVFEIDFEADSVVTNNIDPRSSSGFIDGNFSSGILRKIQTKERCFQMKFNLDSTLLAVGLSDGGGVELYETTQFRLVHTINRLDTVSALDWVEADIPTTNGIIHDDDFIDNLQPRAQLLAVGGFDGFVKVYSISIACDDPSELVTYVDSFRVSSEVCSLSFLKDSATNYAPSPRIIAVGEKNGQVSMVALDGDSSLSRDARRIRALDTFDSAVLSISFGFIGLGIIIASGTKDGELRASLLQLKGGTCQVKCHILEMERTGAIRALRFNHDSSLLIVGGYDRTVLIIDTMLWRIVRELHMDGTVQTIEYDPFNRYLLLGSRSKVMTVVDTSTLHPIKIFNTEGWVTSISWGGHSTIAMRSDDREISLIMFEPIQSLGLTLDSSRGEDCSMSWSVDGRFLARTKGNDVIISDSKNEFATIAKVSDILPARKTDIIRCVRFCHTEGKQDRLACVGRDGFLEIVSLRISVGKVHQQLIASVFLEKNLKSVAWSPDGNTIATGGRETKLHLIDASSIQERCTPLDIGSRVWMIDSLSEKAYNETGEYATSFALAISTGRNVCSVLDLETNEISMEITRKRTVRCQTYHPSLPVLAIGDGSNEVIIVDLIGERKLASFFVDGRVNCIAFSPSGDYVAIGTDEGTITIHDTTNFKCVQEIKSPGKAMGVEFSGSSGQYLALAYANGDVKIVKLGPLLSIDYTRLENVLDLPDWAKQEVIYRSPEGPSFLQRCMLNGSKDSLMCAGSILEEAPESVLTFDRTTGVGCFETAVDLGKPNIMTLILTPVVDGTLDSRSAWSSSLLTTTMPMDGYLTLRELILNHPPGHSTEILSKMTFMKVPFADPRRCHVDDPKECGSSSFTNPWGEETSLLLAKKTDSFRGSFETERKDEITLIPAVLPLPGLGTLDFLSALLSMPSAGPEVFDNDAMGLILIVLWTSGIRQYFLADFMLNILFCACWVHFVDLSASSTSRATINGSIDVTLLAWSVILMNFIFLFKQGVRFATRRGHFFRSSWHIIEVTCVILVFAYSGMVLIDGRRHFTSILISGGKGHVPLAVVTSMFLTAKFVSALRGFDITGYLVAVLVQNFLDVRGFIIVILSILMGFTIIFRVLLADVPGECKVVIEDENILSNDCDGNPFGNLSRSILSTFELTIMGSYENGILYDAPNTFLVSVVFVIAVSVVLVVALNALIAVLGDSFSRVQENVVATRQRERAELCVEYLSMMPNRVRANIEENNRYFHALLASDGHGDLLRHRDDWQGGLNALKKELTEITLSNNEATQRAIDQLRHELSDEFNTMLQNEVSSVLTNVFMELKEISKFRQPSTRTRKAANAAQAARVMGGNNTPFDGIRINHLRDDRSSASTDNDDIDESKFGSKFSI